LALALWETERRQEALDALSRLVSLSPRIQHRMLYASYLGKSEQRGEAQEQLTTAIREFEYSPRYLKRRNRPFVRQAKDMLQHLSMS
jgi:hypothetical protein